MTTPRGPSEEGFDEVRIVEKDIVEPRLQSSLRKLAPGTDGLLVLTLVAMLAVTLLLAKLVPSVSQHLANLQAALAFGR